MEEIIHSGHFMTSNPYIEKVVDEEDQDLDVVVGDDGDQSTNDVISTKCNAKTTCQKHVTYYKFGPNNSRSIDIDVTLNKLQKCIKTAYDRLDTPKWKDFKGLKLNWKQRIRLNNIIWRAYYIEFKKPDKNKKHKTLSGYFAVPDENLINNKFRGTVIEGSYYKRRQEFVAAQYKRWRTFRQKGKRKINSIWAKSGEVWSRKRERSCEAAVDSEAVAAKRRPQSQTAMPSSDYKNFEYDDWENEFTDHLFDSLSEPFFYPHPREGSPSYYNSDFIQPNLFALQPSYEEIIESSENDAFNFASHFSYSPTPTSELQQQPQQQMIRYDDVYRNQRNSKNINYDDNELPSTSAHSHLSSAAPSSFLAPQNMYQHPIYSQASYNMHSLVNPNNLQQQVHQQQQHYISLDGSMCGEPLTSTTNSIAATASPHTMPANYEYMPLIISQLNSAQFTNANNGSSFLGNGQNRNNYDLSNFNQNINFPFPSNNQEISQSNRYWLNNSSRPQSSLLQQQPTAHMNNSLSNNSNNNGNNPFSLSTNNGRDGNIRSNGFSENVESPPVKMASSLSYGVNNNNVVQPRLHRVINSTQECIGGPSRSGTPSKGALKAYPNAKPLSKHSISSLALSSYRNPDDIYSEKQSKMIKKSKTSIVGKRSMDCDHKKNTSLNEAPLSNNSLESAVTNSLSNSDSPRSLASNDIPVSCKTEIEAFESLPNTPVDSTNQCDSTFISHESRKRILHLYAEKNRRTALKDGFEQLLTILPNLHNNGGKNTNAVVLAKSAEYIRDLKIRTESKEQEVSAIKAKIDEMNEKINHYHSNLPSTSNQSNCNINSRLSFEHFFERHAKTKSKEDWHFWLMWKLMKNSIDTYSSTIPEGPLSKTETIDNCKKWLMENFDALHLRPSASQLLLLLATEANFMNDAESLPKFISADIDKR